MTSTLKRLISKGYISFVPDKNDRRIKRVALTKDGRKKREQVIVSIRPLIISQSDEIGSIDYTNLLMILGKIRLQLERRTLTA